MPTVASATTGASPSVVSTPAPPAAGERHRASDTNLINFDGTAGAGTFGEAQISALKNQQVFLWLTNGMKLSNVSPWLLPSVTKVLVDDELWPFLSNFK